MTSGGPLAALPRYSSIRVLDRSVSRRKALSLSSVALASSSPRERITGIAKSPGRLKFTAVKTVARHASRTRPTPQPLPTPPSPAATNSMNVRSPLPALVVSTSG